MKIGGKIYKGNINTTLIPDNSDGPYFCLDGLWVNTISFPVPYGFTEAKTSFDSVAWCKLFSRSENEPDNNGIRKYMTWEREGTSYKGWVRTNSDIGDEYLDLVIKKLPVRMKYKSTPHLIFYADINFNEVTNGSLSIAEITHPTNTRYGGTSTDALKENIWIPCGEPFDLNNGSATPIDFTYGDTYYQRYDCLKTYPYTREDLNQIVEIGSFMLETYVNIDGRYDRNRGHGNNINMSPENFNLMNLVYSQTNNFFSYRIQDDSYYENNRYPNQITWSKTKSSNAETDLWTNITLASILELDGDKGEISKLARLNDQLLCFQNTGISQILYNENVQIASTTGVPIEIANSQKVQGKRYLSNTVGCSNKWSTCNTPAGIYFIDSNDKSLYRIGDGLTNISQQGGFNTWAKKNIHTSNIKWDPVNFNTFVTYYDRLNQDVLFINKTRALAFSEKLGVFTSFYDYGSTPFFCNLDDTGIWINANGSIWKHQAGDYCKFFGEYKPYSITLVGNPEPQIDKIFTNLEFRACITGEGNIMYDTFDSTFDSTFHSSGKEKFNPYLPFDLLEAWNEYQHGFVTLSNKNDSSAMTHHTSDMDASLKRKFRMWRCDIPRNNAVLDKDREDEVTYPYSQDSELNISRFYRKPQDRMRNPWIYLKLQKTRNVSRKCEIHDFVMTYFN